MRSAFGVEHGGISKAYGQIAGKLARVAETAKPGSAAHAYATSRIAAGEQGAGVAQSLKAAKTPLKPGLRGAVANRKIIQANKTATKAARVGRKTGAANAKAARAQVGGTGSFSAINAPTAAAAPTKSRPSWALPLAAGGVGGAGAGFGVAANRKRSA
jgi:hypothetical protein